jgi:SLOG in TRPM, prokaryote
VTSTILVCGASWWLPMTTTAGEGPVVIRVDAANLSGSPPLDELISDYRREADAFLFLSGGASRMSDDAKTRLLGLLGAAEDLAMSGLRLAVGDGGTQAGLMEAAGLARLASGNRFLLLGVAPAPDITLTDEAGKTPVDPNHHAIVAVENSSWAQAQRRHGWTPAAGYWGSETETMYVIFERLARGRRSVTLVANGGAITLDEVEQNLKQRRSMIVVAGSGRAADAIVSVLEGNAPTSQEPALRERVAKLDSAKHRALFTVFRLEDGRPALVRLLRQHLQ